MGSYKNNSWCKRCSEWKEKGLICKDCGQKLRNNRHFKHEKHTKDADAFITQIIQDINK